MLRQVTRWFDALVALTLLAVTLLVSNVLSTHAAAPLHTSAPAQHAMQHYNTSQDSPDIYWRP